MTKVKLSKEDAESAMHRMARCFELDDRIRYELSHDYNNRSSRAVFSIIGRKERISGSPLSIERHVMYIDIDHWVSAGEPAGLVKHALWNLVTTSMIGKSVKR